MSQRFYLCLVLYLGCVVTTMPMPQAKANSLRVATAASFKPILEQLLKTYPHKSQWSVVTGSSGKLASQIMSGAQFQLFLSADEQTVLKLRQQLNLPQKAVFRYGGGQLAQFLRGSPSILSCPAIAVANPRHAPYGKAARQYLDHLLAQPSPAKSKPRNSLSLPKLIAAQNVAQVAQFLVTGAVPCGLLAQSYRDAVTRQTSGSQGFWSAVPKGSYRPFWQAGLVVVPKPEVLALRQYLLAPSSQQRMAALGMTALPERRGDTLR